VKEENFDRDCQSWDQTLAGFEPPLRLRGLLGLSTVNKGPVKNGHNAAEPLTAARFCVPGALPVLDQPLP
jgi:hypothetical protein